MEFRHQGYWKDWTMCVKTGQAGGVLEEEIEAEKSIIRTQAVLVSSAAITSTIDWAP